MQIPRLEWAGITLATVIRNVVYPYKSSSLRLGFDSVRGVNKQTVATGGISVCPELWSVTGQSFPSWADDQTEIFTSRLSLEVSSLWLAPAGHLHNTRSPGPAP